MGRPVRKSDSSRALDALLNDGSDFAKAVADAFTAEKIHRTVVWRYRNGKGKPDADTIAKIERITGGRVPANGWEDKPDAQLRPKAGKRRAS